MQNENVYLVEWRALGEAAFTREIKTATSLAQLFDYYIDIPDLVSFSFEDVTELPVEEIERRIIYHGVYEM